ncbi:MAG: DUF4114 domain-containing protein [Ginsengibacter sp.]
MKAKNYLYLFITLLAFNACKKDPVTKPVKFTSTTYENLGAFNSAGTPLNMMHETISPAMLDFISTTLPDGKNLTLSHPELFTNPAIADITIAKPSDVYITFVSGVSANSNSIAFYTYHTGQPPTTSKDIQLITYIFPNAGHLTGLEPGDKVKLGSFEVGTSIGFVLMQNAWDTTKRTLNNNAVHFCSNDALNPEVDPKLKKHAVLIPYAPENKVLIGFEDRDRTSPDCDNDFNDVVIYCSVVPS